MKMPKVLKIIGLDMNWLIAQLFYLFKQQKDTFINVSV